MNLEQAQRLVDEVTADEPFLRIATHGIREDETHYLIPILNTRPVYDGDVSAHAQSRVLLVDKSSCAVERVSVPDARARSTAMRPVTAT